MSFFKKLLTKALEAIIIAEAKKAEEAARAREAKTPIIAPESKLPEAKPPKLPPPEELLKKGMTAHLFFHGPSGVVKPLFGGKISASQVSGCERIIRAFDKYAHKGTLEQLAYILATSYHETGRKMQPVREAFGTSTQDSINKLERAWKNGQLKHVKTPYWRDGWFGRGDVQLTHKANYKGRLADAVFKKFGVRLVDNPDLALDPEISAYILIEGMMRGDTGLADFTSKPLETFVGPGKKDYRGARATVNPADWSTYDPIAVYAQNFEKALRGAGYEPPKSN